MEDEECAIIIFFSDDRIQTSSGREPREPFIIIKSTSNALMCHL